MAENKARRRKPVEPPPYVSVKDGKVRIEIGPETRAFEPSAADAEEAAAFLVLANVEESGVLCASSVDFYRTGLSVDGAVDGVNVREWLCGVIEQAVALRGLVAVGAIRAELTGA